MSFVKCTEEQGEISVVHENKYNSPNVSLLFIVLTYNIVHGLLVRPSAMSAAEDEDASPQDDREDDEHHTEGGQHLEVNKKTRVKRADDK